MKVNNARLNLYEEKPIMVNKRKQKSSDNVFKEMLMKECDKYKEDHNGEHNRTGFQGFRAKSTI